MLKWKISQLGTNFCNYPIPVRAVYGILPEHYDAKGRHFLKACVWVEDIELAFKNTHFVAFYMRPGYRFPRRLYVSGTSGWARSIQRYIRDNTPMLALPTRTDVYSFKTVTPQILRRDVACASPRFRTVGAYIQRGVPTIDNIPSTMTENFVTHGCKVGKEFFKEEGYCSRVLGMDTPNYNG